MTSISRDGAAGHIGCDLEGGAGSAVSAFNMKAAIAQGDRPGPEDAQRKTHCATSGQSGHCLGSSQENSIQKAYEVKSYGSRNGYLVILLYLEIKGRNLHL